jgi:hypothetical protein
MPCPDRPEGHGHDERKTHGYCPPTDHKLEGPAPYIRFEPDRFLYPVLRQRHQQHTEEEKDQSNLGLDGFPSTHDPAPRVLPNEEEPSKSRYRSLKVY